MYYFTNKISKQTLEEKFGVFEFKQKMKTSLLMN